MSDILPPHLSADRPESEGDTATDTTTLFSEPKSAKDEGLDTLKTLLKNRREREQRMQSAETKNSRHERSGVSETENDSGQTRGVVISARLGPRLSPPLAQGKQALPSLPSKSASTTQEPHLERSVSHSGNTSQTSEMIESASMNILDESANHMFALMKGLNANQPDGDVKRFDPERVNSAVNCANAIYKIMRLKLDAIKEQRKPK